MVARVAAELLRRAARDHRRDVASVRQEALADNAAVAVDVALAAGELLSGDQRAECLRGLRTARGPNLRGVKRLFLSLIMKVMAEQARGFWSYWAHRVAPHANCDSMRRGAACGRRRPLPLSGARSARKSYVGARVFARAGLLSRLANLYENLELSRLTRPAEPRCCTSRWSYPAWRSRWRGRRRCRDTASEQGTGLAAFLVALDDTSRVEPHAERFLTALGLRDRSPYTILAYARGLAHFHGWCDEHGVCLAEVTPTTVQAYVEAFRWPGEGERAAATTNHRLSVLASYFDHLIAAKATRRNGATRPTPCGLRNAPGACHADAAAGGACARRPAPSAATTRARASVSRRDRGRLWRRHQLARPGAPASARMVGPAGR